MGSETPRPRISVIIPTFNRATLLKLSLESLVHQTVSPEEFEVIVVDDGATEATEEVCRSLAVHLPLRYLPVRKNSGISAAKNLGIFAASGQLLLFFDDDDVADRNLLGEHLESHKEHPEENVAVLGYTTWSPSLAVTPVMDYIVNVGQTLFAYHPLENGQELDFTYFWGGRSSCKRSLLVKHGVFNQQFRFGSEDIELGYRLSKLKLRVVFNRNAISHMIRPVTYDEFCKRRFKQGQSQFVFDQLHQHPEVQAHCGVDQAEEKWEHVKQTLQQMVDRVHELEAQFATTLDTHKRESIIKDLHDLYWWTFTGFCIKGIVEAKHSFTSANQNAGTQPRAVRPIAASDLRHLEEKWANRPAPPRTKGSILVMDPWLPMFDRIGGSLRLLHILTSFLRMGYHVTFISRDRSNANRYMPILQELGIEAYAGDPAAMEAEGWLAIFPHVDLEKVLKARTYDLILLSYWSIAEYYLPLVREHSPSSRIIIDTVDIHFLRETRRAELEDSEERKQSALSMRRRELAVYRKADRLWVVTEEDRKAIEGLVERVPIDILPNVHESIDNVKSFEETADLLFVGNFNHAPNHDAMLYFCKEVFPLINKELPEAKVLVVGSNPAEEVKALASERIHVTGHVADLSPYLQHARVSISPLRYGAGMKGKIGEAMAWGLPVVTTSVGAEGMDLLHETDVLIADPPEEFAASVLRLYKDRELWDRLAQKGRRTVAERWSPEAMESRLVSVLTETFRHPVRNQLSVKEAPEMLSQNPQVVGATPEIINPTSGGLVSIIILAHNQLADTQRCLESLRRNTTAPHELILVDNGSTDGTGECFSSLQQQWHERQQSGAGLQDNPCQDLKVIRHAENLGFAQGNNAGIAVAQGDYVLLLNNDTVVTPGWLERLVRSAELDPNIGLVGPVSNNVSGHQLIQPVDYDVNSLEGLEDFAAMRARQQAGKVLVTWRVVGFCMLIKRAVVDKIGGLDSRFGRGNFEDDDFCLRAIIAGRVAVIAQDCFIHHLGSRTFAGQNVDYREALTRNWEILKQKWGLPAELPYGSHYDISWVFNQPFDPERHFCALQVENGQQQTLPELIDRFHEHLSASDLHGMEQVSAVAVENFGDHPNAWLLRALSLRLTNQLEGASSAIERSLQLKETPEALFELIHICLAADQAAEARRTAERLKGRFPAWVEHTCETLAA